MKNAKKILSVVLSLIMVTIFTLGSATTALAGGWADKITTINLNEENTLYWNGSYRTTESFGSYGFRQGVNFEIPARGSLEIVSYSEYKYGNPDITIYDSNNLETAITDRYYDNSSYISSIGMYKSTINISLDAGYYCALLYIYDCSDDIKYGRTDDSFKITFNYKLNISSPSTFKVSSRNTNSIKLSWNKIGNVSGYQIQRKSGDSYITVANTTATSYTVTDLASATNYSFRVRAYKTVDGKKYYSSWKTLTTPTKPAKVSIKTPATNSKHQIIAKWNKVTRASGYQVQYCKNKSCSSVIVTKTVSGQSKVSYTGKNFTKNKTYYVRVRAYKTVNNTKYYGAWSSVKSIKCK